MNVALFGGTFDPVHIGHVLAARAAMAAYGLGQIHFVPSSQPPHKRNRPLTAFAHRYAMVSLACAGIPQFVPSLLEAPGPDGTDVNYSLLTVQKMAASLSADDRLFFLVGADAFLDVSLWHEPVALLDSCDFIVISRPGFPISQIEKAVPVELGASPANATSIQLRRTRLHLLNAVTADVSSSNIRRLASEGNPIAGMVPDAVAEYIQKVHIYS